MFQEYFDYGGRLDDEVEKFREAFENPDPAAVDIAITALVESCDPSLLQAVNRHLTFQYPQQDFSVAERQNLVRKFWSQLRCKWYPSLVALSKQILAGNLAVSATPTLSAKALMDAATHRAVRDLDCRSDPPAASLETQQVEDVVTDETADAGDGTANNTEAPKPVYYIGEWYRQLLEGDERYSFSKLYEVALRSLWKFESSRVDIELIASEAVAASIRRDKPPLVAEHLFAYVQRAARNRAVDFVRRSESRPHFQLDTMTKVPCTVDVHDFEVDEDILNATPSKKEAILNVIREMLRGPLTVQLALLIAEHVDDIKPRGAVQYAFHLLGDESLSQKEPSHRTQNSRAQFEKALKKRLEQKDQR